MSKVKKAQQNLTLPIDVIDNLRNLSSYRKYRGVEPSTMADIVTLCLNRYFEENGEEITIANALIDKNYIFAESTTGAILEKIIDKLPADVVENLNKLKASGANFITAGDINSNNIKNLNQILTKDEVLKIRESAEQVSRDELSKSFGLITKA